MPSLGMELEKTHTQFNQCQISFPFHTSISSCRSHGQSIKGKLIGYSWLTLYSIPIATETQSPYLSYAICIHVLYVRSMYNNIPTQPVLWLPIWANWKCACCMHACVVAVCWLTSIQFHGPGYHMPEVFFSFFIFWHIPEKSACYFTTAQPV